MQAHPDPRFARLLTALGCGIPDRVPIAEITIDEGAKEAYLDRPVNDLDTDIEFYISSGYDFITLGRRLAGYPPVWPAAGLENYYEVQRATAHGAMGGVIATREDYRDYPWMRPEELDLRILDKAESVLPRSMKVIRYVSPVFQLAWMLMGFENLSFALADDPGLVEAVMDRIFEVVYREVEDAVARDVIGAVWFGDDIAIKDRLMVPPAFLRRAFFPKLGLIGKLCRDRGIPLLYHTDGDVSDVLEDIMGAGVSALHPVDPTAMDIYAVKRLVQGRLCLIGNVDVSLLVAGRPEEVAAETSKQIRLLGPGGGYVLGSGNSIPRATKPANYRAMLETALREGAYPMTA